MGSFSIKWSKDRYYIEYFFTFDFMPFDSLFKHFEI